MHKTFAAAFAALTVLGGAGTAVSATIPEKTEKDPATSVSQHGGLFTTVTGKLVRAESGYAITDSESGTSYALDFDSKVVLPYVGERVRVTGSLPGRFGGDTDDPLTVRTVEPVESDGKLPERGTTELRMQVRTDGNVPAGMTFYGLFDQPEGPAQGEVDGIEDLGAIALNDFDGDGVYSASVGLRQGSSSVARVAVGSTATGPREVIHPQSTVRQDNTVVLDGDTTVTADYTPVRSCGDVPFSPETDHGAFGVNATGVDCGVARDVAADAEGNLGENYRSHDFTCLAEESGGELGGYDYTCLHGVRKVTFSAS
ncbi:hypothetical protein [Actinopolyspora mortivallis]|uniref:hypothetical protein n=1 Tax=Actinopolyspora mortivallis TaxID=33906 RepID=UPI00037A4089|nr:hypothetical protein [Actinopolyspora mortivallis]